jgi:siroheme synthase-like protein
MSARSFVMALVLEGKRCLVIGAGDEAAARARALSECGADVVVVGAGAGPELEALAARGAIALERRAWLESDLDECWLVVLADRDEALLARLGPACAARRLWFCAIDQPGWNSAHNMSVVRSGPVTLAVSTDGRAPALAKRLREELERLARESGLGAFAEELAELRNNTPPGERAAALERALEGLFLGHWDVPRR